MRQIVITAAGGPEKLVVRDAPEPQPLAGTVRVRVRASGINFADILARKGLYPDAPKIPCVVGYEVSGTVDAVGDGVDATWVGREVLAMTRFGGYADVVVVPLDQVFDKPASLSFEQAAAIPVNYVTAWQLLVTMGSLSAGETVLIHNAGGGVGLAAIDVARHIGARIIGTASAGKHAFLKQRGLHEAIDYRTQDWTLEVARLTANRGVELITDRADEQQPLGVRRQPRSHVARDGDAATVDAGDPAGRRRRLGAAACRPDVRVQRRRRRSGAHGGASQYRQGRADPVEPARAPIVALSGGRPCRHGSADRHR